jgi:hypothetical protein
VKTQHNIGCRNALIFQDLSDRRFGAIVLNPDFAVLDIKVKNEIKNTFLLFSTDVGELIMIMFCVANNFCFYVIGVGVGMSLFGENLKLIHALISSSIGS